ncbi:hypothetical protein BC829DRAFT_394202 [Chytridium lagenaria]|nr:hypothetical protein BC829DRAFT_394202 [Chytridium lagenaria]
MSTLSHRTFMGFSTIYFLFSGAHTAMRNESHDKWINIVNNVREGSKVQVEKNLASAWYEAELAKKEGKDAGKH